MKYFLITILIIFLTWAVFLFKADNTDNELVSMYDDVISDFEEVLTSVPSADLGVEKEAIEEEVKEQRQEEEAVEEMITEESLPGNILLDVDFTSQAPFRDWGYPWQEACEEASVLMAMRYFDGRGIKNKYDARDALQQIIDWENKNFGFYKDTTATTTIKIITDFYNHKDVELSFDVTTRKIKKEIAKGNLIIVPVAGRNLENPYFTPPGPIYHNLVIIGYDDKKQIFYTNDPGIMSGGNFKYSYNNIIDSIADWDYEKKTINKERRVMIIVKKSGEQPDEQG